MKQMRSETRYIRKEQRDMDIQAHKQEHEDNYEENKRSYEG